MMLIIGDLKDSINIYSQMKKTFFKVCLMAFWRNQYYAAILRPTLRCPLYYKVTGGTRLSPLGGHG